MVAQQIVTCTMSGSLDFQQQLALRRDAHRDKQAREEKLARKRPASARELFHAYGMVVHDICAIVPDAVRACFAGTALIRRQCLTEMAVATCRVRHAVLALFVLATVVLDLCCVAMLIHGFFVGVRLLADTSAK